MTKNSEEYLERPDIAEAVTRMPSTFGAKKELRQLPQELWEGESVRHIAIGTYADGNGIIVATDRRLLFLYHGMARQVSEGFAYDRISSIEFKGGMVLATIVVYVSNQKAEIKNVGKDEAKRIVDDARKAMHNEPTASSGVVESSASVQDELLKLKELQNAGVINEDTYQAQAQPLLKKLGYTSQEPSTAAESSTTATEFPRRKSLRDNPPTSSPQATQSVNTSTLAENSSQQQTAPAHSGSSTRQASQTQKPWYKKWWVWVIIVLGFLGFFQSLSEESEETTETFPTQTEAPQETEQEMPDEEPELEPELPPATDEDLSAAVQEFMDERAEDGVMLAQSVTEVSADGGVVTVIFNPSQAGAETDALLSLAPYDNFAEFASTPFVWTTPESTNLRGSLTRVDTFLSTGEDLGSLTVEEISEMHDLP
jgi:hypothetical protein